MPDMSAQSQFSFDNALFASENAVIRVGVGIAIGIDPVCSPLTLTLIDPDTDSDTDTERKVLNWKWD